MVDVTGARLAAAAVLATLTAAAPVSAEEAWSFRLTPYAWAPSLDGNYAIDGDPASGSTSLLDILDFAFLLSGEARKGDWGLLFEVNYLELSDDVSALAGFVEGEAKLDGVMAGAAIAYRFFEDERARADVFGGFRYWTIDAQLDVDALGSPKRESDWFDPIIGVRGGYDVTESIFVEGLGEIGGFGVGSEFQWELVGKVGYRFNDTFSLAAGYRHLAVDFDDDGLVLDAALSGPFLALDINF